MLFHEIYSSYYRTVAKILHDASDKDISGRELRSIVEQTAFSESSLWIPEALISGKWALLEDGCRSVLYSPPEMPITTLEKRWLKALLLDPRIQLFSPPMDGLEDVIPLYRENTFVWFDRYQDADPYSDPGYIQIFRTLLTAINKEQGVYIRYRTAQGQEKGYVCSPYRLEYSEKDDKFRVLAMHSKLPLILNLSRIQSCTLCDSRPASFCAKEPDKSSLVLTLTDDRNALERAMLHFSHLEKETRSIGEKQYQITLWYHRKDEPELLIRILSFGPRLQVVSPDSFVTKIRQRLHNQKNLRIP